MAERPTIKLKTGAPPRDPQRSRVRATTAPRKAGGAAAAPAAPPAGPRARPERTGPGKGKPPARPQAAAQGPGAAGARPAPAGAAPRPARRVLPAAAPATPASRQAAERPRPVNSRPDEGIRLSKHLTDQGIASRREADDWIAAGWVRVDGEMAVLGQRVRPEQRIDIDPAARKEQARSVTILLNKPVAYVSGQAEDGYPPAASLVTEAHRWADEKRPFHPGHARGLAPAGRLDIDSTGLLVLTQDGRVARQLIGEDSELEKEYLVRVVYHGPGQAPISHPDARSAPLQEIHEHDPVSTNVQAVFPPALLDRLRHGLSLDGQPLKPARVEWQNPEQLRFVLTEGKKRQIRRMCEQVGLKVVGLKRIRMGRITLGNLPVGQWRYLAPGERF